VSEGQSAEVIDAINTTGELAGRNYYGGVSLTEVAESANENNISSSLIISSEVLPT
jgi:hypothetical protein